MMDFRNITIVYKVTLKILVSAVRARLPLATIYFNDLQNTGKTQNLSCHHCVTRNLLLNNPSNTVQFDTLKKVETLTVKELG